MRKTQKLKQVLDRSDGFISGGHQIVSARTYKRAVPRWTKNDRLIRELLLKTFPKMATDSRQHDSAARWGAVIHLYFRMGYTRSQIAEEIGSTSVKIHGIIRSILRVSKGIRADGRGPLGRPKGRPKNAAL